VTKRTRSRQVVALQGGLGNQLFQFSYALYLARHWERVNLDLSCIRRGVPAIFGVPLIGEQARQMALRGTRFLPSPSGRLPLVGKLSRKALRPGPILVSQSPQGHVPVSNAAPAWWFGYWQRLRYAEAVIPLLRTGLAIAPAPAPGTVDQHRPAVVRIHVRRGDYAGNPWELPAEWYARALDLAHPAGGDDVNIEVVTNDPEWCRQNLDLRRLDKILPTGTALEDMQCLAASDVVIISRSTFSWWAAAISDATVVAPYPWFPAMPLAASQDLLPHAWLSCPVQPDSCPTKQTSPGTSKSGQLRLELEPGDGCPDLGESTR
jgi:hypothetical protein